MHAWMNCWMDGWMDGRMDGWTDGRMDGWIDEGMDGWMDGWIGECRIKDSTINLGWTMCYHEKQLKKRRDAGKENVGSNDG